MMDGEGIGGDVAMGWAPPRPETPPDPAPKKGNCVCAICRIGAPCADLIAAPKPHDGRYAHAGACFETLTKGR